MHSLKKKLTISVCIITKDRTYALLSCLLSLNKQTYLPNEVIVVDNSAISNHRKANSFPHKYDFVYLHKPHLKIPQLRNVSLEKASGTLILTIDDDCIASKDWIESMVSFYMKYPHTWALSGKVIPIPHSSVYALIIKTVREQRSLLTRNFNHPIHIDTANALFVKKYLLHNNINFDSTIIRGSDCDIAAQIISKGGNVKILSNAIVYHKERTQLLSFLVQRFKNGKAVMRIKNKWPSLQFYYYRLRPFDYISPFLSTITFLSRKNDYLKMIKYIGIIFLSVIFHELGYLYQKILPLHKSRT